MGIESITERDLLAARRKGFLIKLIAGVRREGVTVSLRIGPALVPKSHRLPKVSLARNGLSIGTLFSGELVFEGEPAGNCPKSEKPGSTRAREAVHFVRIAAVGGRLPPNAVMSAFCDAGVRIIEVEFRPGHAVAFTRTADECSIQRALRGIPGAGPENILIVPALGVAWATSSTAAGGGNPRRIVEIETPRITA